MVATKARIDLKTLHALMGHYARQHEDIQRQRIAVNNRIKAMERDGLGVEWTLPLRGHREQLEALEQGVGRMMERLARQHPLRNWIEQEAKGMSLRSFVLLFGVTGPLDRFPTVSKLWKYVGMAVVDGSSDRLKRGQKATYSPTGKVRCFLLGEAIVRVGEGGKYRRIYDEKKAYYEANRPDWPQIHRHNAAKRYAVKEMLKDMWVEWRRVVSVEEAA